MREAAGAAHVSRRPQRTLAAKVPISLTQLQTFVRLSELGNFTRTAEELGVTPPAVTLQIRALSDHFGVPLVDIVKRRPILTRAGRFLAQRSRSVLESVAALEREMERFTAGETQPLILGATVTVGNYILTPLLAEFEANHSHGDIDVRYENPAQLAALLRSREASIVLGSDLPKDDDFDARPFAQDHLVLIVPAKGHRFSRRRTVRAADLIGEVFVSREADSPTRLLAERALREHGVRVHTKLVVPSLEGVVRAVEAGLGVAIVSWLVVERLLQHKRVHAVEIRDLDLRRQFEVVTLRDADMSTNALAFIDFLKTSAAPQNRRKPPLKAS
jgi:DNA-binding transcriptional LysR family regulator